MTLSVIIPTYNPAAYLAPLQAALKRQSVPFELVIVDSSSSDGSAPVLEAMADRFLRIDAASFDHGGTRTLAAKAATGDVLLFLTQDALPASSDTFVILRDFLLRHPRLGAAYGRQLPYPDATLFGRHLRLFNYPPSSYVRTLDERDVYGIKTAFLSDSFAIYRKEALADIGWFKERLIVGEDTYAGASLLAKGYALGYCAEAEVYHSHNYTIAEEMRRYFDIGVFHTEESWILRMLGRAEGEGMRYIRSEWALIAKERAYGYIPAFFLRNSAKYLGYKLGRNHRKLPHALRTALSMHPTWWQKLKSETA